MKGQLTDINNGVGCVHGVNAAARVAKQLRTPLISVRHLIDSIQTSGQQPSAAVLEQITKMSDNYLDAVDDLLLLERLLALDKRSGYLEPTSALHIGREVMSSFGIIVKDPGRGSLPLVFSNAFLLERVLYRLGSYISNSDQDLARFRLNNRSGKVQLTLGVSQDDRSDLLRSLSESYQTTPLKATSEQSGIGLMIAHELAQLLGHQIKFAPIRGSKKASLQLLMPRTTQGALL